MHEHKSNLLTPDERFARLDFILTDQLGSRPLARKAGLSGSHVNRILHGKIKNLTVATATKIARAAQLPLDDVIFYVVERQREYERSRVNASK